MAKPTFQITLTDGTTYTRGTTTDAFRDLGYASAELKDYDHDGEMVDLEFTNGLTLSIPEYHVLHIATSKKG